MNTMLLNDVTKRFGTKVVLDHVSLDIHNNELFGLLGPSGAGKTTLIRILTGQILSDGGAASLFGKNSSSFGNDVYRQIGIVVDNCGLYQRLTCWDNMKLFADIHQVPASEITKVLERVGLTDAVKTTVSNLSKGMKERLLLARAILHKPKILFLDEPTSGLDPATQLEIHKLLNELKAEGTTIFLTTHNMTEAYNICDHIALLNEGKIVEYGVPEEICRKYNKENLIHILLKDGTNITLENSSENADQIYHYLLASKVSAIHSSEPDLGTVFMKLTGRGLLAE